MIDAVWHSACDNESYMELYSYQETAHHGHAVARFHPGPKPNAKPKQAPYKFKNDPHEFYVHPSVSACKLNKLLYDSRHKPIMRQALLKDQTAVGNDYGLRPDEVLMLAEVCKLVHNNSDHPALDADPLVAMGAHPLGALMAIHLLQSEQRKLLRGAA